MLVLATNSASTVTVRVLSTLFKRMLRVVVVLSRGQLMQNKKLIGTKKQHRNQRKRDSISRPPEQGSGALSLSHHRGFRQYGIYWISFQKGKLGRKKIQRLNSKGVIYPVLVCLSVWIEEDNAGRILN